MALGILLAALDKTTASTALPTIVGDPGGAGHLSGVVTAHLLAETVSTALVGKFGDVFGRKRMFPRAVGSSFGVAVFDGGYVSHLQTGLAGVRLPPEPRARRPRTDYRKPLPPRLFMPMPRRRTSCSRPVRRSR